MLIWFCGIIIEIIIFGIWYRFIYNNSNKSNKSFIRLLVQSVEFIWLWGICKLFPDKGKETLKEFIKKQHIQSTALNFNYLLFLWAAFIFPGVVSLFMQSISLWLFAIIGLGMIVEAINKYKVELSLFLDEYIKFLTKFQRIKQEIKSKKITREKRKGEKNLSDSLHKRKVKFQIAFIITIGGTFIILCIWDLALTWTDNLQNSFLFFNTPIVNVLFAFLIVAVCIFILSDKTSRENIKKDIHHMIIKLRIRRKKRQKEIIIANEFKEVGINLEDILEMCRKQNIFDVIIYCTKLESKVAISGYDKENGNYIILGKEIVEELQSYFNKEDFCEMVLLLLGHELTHIKYKDYDDRKACIKYFLLFSLFIAISFVIILIIGFITKNYRVCFNLEVLLLLIVFIAEKIIMKRKFWKQVMEFRADRIGLEVSHAKVETFEKFLTYFEVQQKEKDNILSKFCKRYIEEKDHPGTQRRKIEIKRGKWKKREYIRYLWLVGQSVYSGKGWYL